MSRSFSSLGLSCFCGDKVSSELNELGRFDQRGQGKVNQGLDKYVCEANHMMGAATRDIVLGWLSS